LIETLIGPDVSFFDAKTQTQTKAQK